MKTGTVMRTGRSVIDTHVHGQGVAVGFENRGETSDDATPSRPTWGDEAADHADDDADIVTYGNAGRHLYGGDPYDVEPPHERPFPGYT